jgi:hypothetical protein
MISCVDFSSHLGWGLRSQLAISKLSNSMEMCLFGSSYFLKVSMFSLCDIGLEWSDSYFF